MAKTPSPTALMQTMAGVDRLRQLLGEDADSQLVLDTIEGETNALEMLDAIVETILADEALANAAKERATRMEARADKRRAIVQRIMERIGQKKLERPLATLVIAAGPTSVVIAREDLVPNEYWRSVLDKHAINRAIKSDLEVPGATLSNAPPVLRILIK